ncbi:23S rRNA (adenine1618-N6)-methyltransferase [Lewinella marina]|uniref:Ribosomal RNA large subunit methyltransferase F n=1 Tax=Neolewinella marina TaxID=438751 RepID=A0A2G0CFE7_9BACT|nr:23S rRNA (adenine(1618)-N(6))-methyltransferase RlmF [Neolewinella marina]NJB85619.1 23S rRNA (adenine1618-N6)-methyltransferase [Neolewinella marina]PHK98696.1 23S rRNA (adenine(1618)-N(6))-methyltransferase RlmF [Neolewinella marina]
MHPRNRYRGKHDFTELCRLEPGLKQYLFTNPVGKLSLDFSRNEALRLLNRVLLLRDYGLQHWDLPDGHLVPPLPGRLDYIHTIADLLPKAQRVLDIGTGASVIYPILGVGEYGWSFVGSEVNPDSVRVARAIVKFNPKLRRHIEIRQQEESAFIFRGIIQPEDYFHLTLCNPPFYADRESAERAGEKKWRKLGRTDGGLSFGGADSELWTPGGEMAFLRRMIRESQDFSRQVGWFTTLVSKKGYLRSARQLLDALEGVTVRVLSMEQGNKKSRVLAWTFTDPSSAG